MMNSKLLAFILFLTIIAAILFSGCAVDTELKEKDKFYSGEPTGEPYGAKVLRNKEKCANPTGDETEHFIEWCNYRGFDIQGTK